MNKLILAVLACSYVVFADSVQSQQLNFSLAIANATNTAIPLSGRAHDSETLTFNQFNPALGALTSIEFLLSNSTQSVNLEVTGSRPSPNRFFTSTSGGGSDGLGTIPFNGGTLPLLTFVQLVAASCSVTGVSCFDDSIEGGAVTGSFSSINTAGYVGTGTIAVILDLFASRTNPVGVCVVSIISSCNGQMTRTANIDAAWDGLVTLNYYYEPAAVPEPSTWFMGAIGAGVCLCRGRRYLRPQSKSKPGGRFAELR